MANDWSVVRLEPHREKLALHFLALNGFTTYLPRIREVRVQYGRRIGYLVPLFPGYCFVVVQLQWHQIFRTPGTRGLIMDGMAPAKVPDAVITEIRDREIDGLVQLQQPAQHFQPGAPVRITQGPLAGQLGLYAGMPSRERVSVLLKLLGTARRVSLARDDIEAV
jgi:transcriptional antiterminator RfaH